MPPEGYNIPYLKEVIGGSTLIYLQPMKNSLSMEKVTNSIHTNYPCTKCSRCEKQIPIVNLREHNNSFEENRLPDLPDLDLEEDENDDVFCIDGPSSSKSPDEWTSLLKAAFLNACDKDVEDVSKLAVNIDEAAVLLLEKINPIDEATKENNDKPFNVLLDSFIAKK